MSEAMSDALSSLREHAPSLPTKSAVTDAAKEVAKDAKSAAKDVAKDAKEAVKSSLPSAKDAKDAVKSSLPSAKDAKDAVVPSASDAKDAVKEHLPSRPGKRSFVMLAGLLALGALALAFLRRKSASGAVSPSIYTPPLPKP
jgi:uncharacterized membrane protein